jgi:Uma2 family endonuclease
VRLDWVCEVVQDLGRIMDRVEKRRRFEAAGLSHYWIVDLVEDR